MKEKMFRQLLRSDRRLAASKLAVRKVDEWMNDGPTEIARVITNWIEQKLDLGDDDTLVEMAAACGVIDDER